MTSSERVAYAEPGYSVVRLQVEATPYASARRIGVLGRAKHRRGIQVSALRVMAPIAHDVAATGDVRATPTA
jgi:hypothetical protein